MRLFVRITALLLLALWLPATEHCALEAAGVISTTCHDDGATTSQPCATDTCAALESAHYRAMLPLLQIVPPAAHDGLSLLCLALSLVPLERTFDLPQTQLDRPKDWLPVWHFVRRAAPPSRAPALFLA